MNSGQIRSSAVSTFSRTMRRAHSDLRLRRKRVVSSSGCVRAGASASTARKRGSIGRPYLIAMGLLRNAIFLLVPGWPGQCSGGRAFDRDLGFEVLLVAEDRRDGENLAVAAIAQDAILVADIALDRDIVPFLGVTDI